MSTTQQKQEYLPMVIEGEWSPYTAALIEYVIDFDPIALKTMATASGGQFILNGEKAFVPFAKDAEAFLVYADLNGVTQGFILPKGAAGLTISVEREKLMILNAHPMYRVKLDSVKVPASNRLGGASGHDFDLILASMRVATAAAAVGVANAAFEYSKNYAKEREAFGVKIAQKQAIAFMLAGGVNFAVHFIAWKRLSPQSYVDDAETSGYVVIFAVASVLAAAGLYFAGADRGAMDAVRLSTFHVASVMTTTGFTTDNFALWPLYTPFLMVLLDGDDKMGLIKVLIVDSQPLFRAGVIQALTAKSDFEISEANPGDNLPATIETRSPEVVLIDIDPPSLNGLKIGKSILQLYPSTRLVIMTPESSNDELFEAIRMGATAYMDKKSSVEDLEGIIRRVSRGEYPINDSLLATPKVAEHVLKQFQEMVSMGMTVESIAAPLTNRETQILRYVADGNSNKKIAQIRILANRP